MGTERLNTGTKRLHIGTRRAVSHRNRTAPASTHEWPYYRCSYRYFTVDASWSVVTLHGVTQFTQRSASHMGRRCALSCFIYTHIKIYLALVKLPPPVQWCSFVFSGDLAPTTWVRAPTTWARKCQIRWEIGKFKDGTLSSFNRFSHLNLFNLYYLFNL